MVRAFAKRCALICLTAGVAGLFTGCNPGRFANVKFDDPPDFTYDAGMAIVTGVETVGWAATVDTETASIRTYDANGTLIQTVLSGEWTGEWTVLPIGTEKRTVQIPFAITLGDDVKRIEIHVTVEGWDSLLWSLYPPLEFDWPPAK